MSSIQGFIYSNTQTNVSTGTDSGPLTMVPYDLIGIDINVTAISAGSVQFFYERQDAFGNWFPLWTSAVISAVSKTSATIGAGCGVNHTIGFQGRLRWVITTGPVTFTSSIMGQ